MTEEKRETIQPLGGREGERKEREREVRVRRKANEKVGRGRPRHMHTPQDARTNTSCGGQRQRRKAGEPQRQPFSPRCSKVEVLPPQEAKNDQLSSSEGFHGNHRSMRFNSLPSCANNLPFHFFFACRWWLLKGNNTATAVVPSTLLLVPC